MHYFPKDKEFQRYANSEGISTSMSGSKNAQRVDFNVVTLETGSTARFFRTYANTTANYTTPVNIALGFNKVEIPGVSGTNWNGKYRKLSIQFNNGSGDQCIIDYMKINGVVLFGTPPADPTPPAITLSGDSTVTVPLNGVYNDDGATASDDRDGDITGNISTVGLPIDTSTPGTYTITYSVSDAGGNTVSVSRTVIVEDTVEEARTGTHYIGFSDFKTADVSTGAGRNASLAESTPDVGADSGINISITGGYGCKNVTTTDLTYGDLVGDGAPYPAAIEGTKHIAKFTKNTTNTISIVISNTTGTDFVLEKIHYDWWTLNTANSAKTLTVSNSDTEVFSHTVASAAAKYGISKDIANINIPANSSITLTGVVSGWNGNNGPQSRLDNLLFEGTYL